MISYYLSKFVVFSFFKVKMARCIVTGKGNLYGRSHTHHRGVAGGRWKKRAQKTQRIFRPNLQTVTIITQTGDRQQVRVSTKALKRIKKDFSEGRPPALNLAIFSK
jgi:large subunit ribosomal protein L28